MIFSIIQAVSLIWRNLDLLLMEIADSNSALIVNKEVFFFNFRFSHINSNPVAKMDVEASKKGSSATNSSLKALASVALLS